MTLLSLDPSVTDEKSGLKRDPELDMTNRLIRHAKERITLINQGKGFFTDDEPFVIPGGAQVAFCNKFFPQMTKFFSHTQDIQPLIHADGSVTEKIVPCLRSPRGMADATSRLNGGGRMTTVRTFLSSMAVRALADYHYDETTLYGVDWKSSYAVTVGNAGYIEAPLLLMGMTGSYEYISAEHVYRIAKSCKDKEIAFVEGAGHNFTPIPGQESAVKACFDYVDHWIERKLLD